jgi:hypothetical protein
MDFSIVFTLRLLLAAATPVQIATHFMVAAGYAAV